MTSHVGHLHQIREHITVEDNSMRWVTRTYWSRTRRSAAWWEEFARARNRRIVTDCYEPGLARVEEAEPVGPSEPVGQAEADQEPDGEPRPSAAYQALTELHGTDPRMPLSESDCRSLESLAAEWLSRGSTPRDITRALTGGLPSEVTNPGGLARKRLEKKMPPKKSKVRQKKAPLRARIDRVPLACITCDADERTVEIVGGVCRPCRVELGLDTPDGEPIPSLPETLLAGPVSSAVDVHAWAARVRAAGGLRTPAGKALWEGV
ncbi:hypothetical protein ABT072_22910 [Streptomyces sp. NPDC002589]|uniref:hypothetical protein n=1 Tax=Streptomyces sp. NPDC002589 TaxID=3154420 RepID=UPI003320F179